MISLTNINIKNPFLEKVTTISTYFCCRLFGEDTKKEPLRGFLKQLRWNVWKVSRKKKSENICDGIKWVETLKDFIYKDSLKNNFSYISILYESTTDLYDHVMPYNTNIYYMFTCLFIFFFRYCMFIFLCIYAISISVFCIFVNM